MSDAVAPLPPVTDSLFAPLLQWAGEALRALEASDVPPAVRPLLSFDKRGFGSASARQQLRRALDTEDDFRARIFETVAGREEVTALTGDWSAPSAIDAAVAAEARDDLPLLASALAVAQPEGWQLGVGVIAGLWERGIERRAADDDQRAFDVQVRKAEEAQRRAEAEVRELRGRLDAVSEELRDERSTRRDREDAVRAEAAGVERRVQELEAELQAANEARERAEERAAREAGRADGFDAQLKERAADLARARGEIDEARRAAEHAEAEARRARGETERVPTPSATPYVAEEEEDEPVDEGPALTRRVRVPLPPGVIGPSIEGLRHAVSSGEPAPAIVVDGYNVSMLAWGGDPPDTQRQRLCALLEGLYLRSNRPVTVVFDGADVEGVRPPRRPGVRVLFSEPGEEADDVVIREVASLPLARPVIAVSSDRRVQEAVEDRGALAVPSQVFLEFLRR